MQQVYDVAIVGAGPAGSACAMHLARRGWRVVIVDKSRFPRHKPCAEYLSPAAEPLLRAMGVLDALAATRPARLKGFRIYAPDGSWFQGDFAASRRADGTSYYETGLAIPRYTLDNTLLRATQAAGAEAREGWRLDQLTRDQAKGITTLTPAGDQEPIQARIIIAADGAHSTVARRLGLQRNSRMRKIALVAHLCGIRDLTEYGEMHVAGRRYVGIAPLEPVGAGDRCNVALVVDEARDGRKLAGKPEAFLLDALATFPRLRDRIADVSVARPTLTVSRICARVSQLATDGVLLAGDAAGYYDPFTGEGIYRALRGAELAAEVASDALNSGECGAATLARYDHLYHAEFRGKRVIEGIIQSAVQMPPLMNHIAWIMRRRPWMAHRIVAVTGDFLPPTDVLNPGYLLRLLI